LAFDTFLNILEVLSQDELYEFVSRKICLKHKPYDYTNMPYPPSPLTPPIALLELPDEIV
jgi:hypothetical protein